MREFAFLRLTDSAYAVGEGPFARAAECPAAPAFYVNGFDLDEPEPWRIPATARIVEDIDPLAGKHEIPQLGPWTPPARPVFREIFDRWQQLLQEDHLQKVVPVVSEFCQLLSGNPRAWIRSIAVANLPLWAYGWFLADSGFLGLTPERFIHVEGDLLVTAALAGTSRPGQESVFLNDPKQVREHELVVEDLLQILSRLGRAERSPRRILQLQGLIHYLSEFRVRLERSFTLNEIIQLVHPTPAMGVLPRQRSLLELLLQDRRSTDTPAAFGAPFGYWDGERFHSVVAIRGVFWNDGRISLPSGCGLVRESKLENEWQELALKRHVVKAMMHLV